MSTNEQVQGMVLVREEQRGWSPNVELILAFIIGFLALSPAILGIYWELLLP